MSRGLLLGCVVLAVGTACGGGGNAWVLPDRNDPDVRQTESKLADIVEVGNGWRSKRWDSCDVRLLGESGKTYYVWAACVGAGKGATWVPLRIEGETVTSPRDGGYYADDVRALFPEDLADEIFEHSERLQP